MLSDRNRVFKKLFEEREEVIRESIPAPSEDDSMLDEIVAIKEQLLEEFGHAVAEPKELAEAQETLGKLAENAMKAMIESDEVTSLDIKEAKMLRAQISLQKQMAKKETYSVPVLVGDEVTNVTLKIVRGVEKRGIVDVMLESQLAGKIAATFQAKEKGISGVIATDREAARADMQEQIQKLVEALQDEETEAIDIKVAHIPDLNLNHFTSSVLTKENSDIADTQIKEAPEKTDAYQVQTSRLYHIAEAFIRVMRENYK